MCYFTIFKPPPTGGKLIALVGLLSIIISPKGKGRWFKSQWIHEILFSHVQWLLLPPKEPLYVSDVGVRRVIATLVTSIPFLMDRQSIE